MGMGGLSCGGTIAKWTLFCFNIVFWLCSLAILGVGIWLAVDPNGWDYVEIIQDGGMSDPLLAAAVWCMIGVGAFMFIVGFAGCWGACRESSAWLNIYCFLVGLCLLVEITAAILALVYKDKINDSVRDGMYEQVQDHYGDDDHSPTLTEAWDAMQQDMECCGSNDYNDYNGSYYHTHEGNLVPESCCDDVKTNSTEYATCLNEAADGATTDTEYLYTEGCYDELKSAIDDAVLIIACVMFGLALLQLIGLLLACCLKGDVAQSNTYM